MSHTIPTLRIATHQTYTPPAAQRKTHAAETTGDASGSADFHAMLSSNNLPAPSAAATAPVPVSIATATPSFPAVPVTSPATSSSSMAPAAQSATTANPPGSADFRALFNTNNRPDPPVAATTAWPMAPTVQSLFGDNPWCTDAGGTGPQGAYCYNPVYFATPATAAKVAQMLGGKVVAMDSITPFGPFKQNQPNLMVQMPDGKLINAGLIAGLYSHGYSKQTVDRLISQEVNGDLIQT